MKTATVICASQPSWYWKLVGKQILIEEKQRTFYSAEGAELALYYCPQHGNFIPVGSVSVDEENSHG